MTIFIEGGGATREQQAGARQAFQSLFMKAGLKGRLPKTVLCGGRIDTIEAFRAASRAGNPAALLIDAEGSVETSSGAAAHLRRRGELKFPAPEERTHLMVQVMETWFLAQPAVLAEFFRDGFDKKALPRQAALETIPKDSVLRALDRATRMCRSGPYTKSKRRGFEILERLDPAEIGKACPFARRFFDWLRLEAERDQSRG